MSSAPKEDQEHLANISANPNLYGGPSFADVFTQTVRSVTSMLPSSSTIIPSAAKSIFSLSSFLDYRFSSWGEFLCDPGINMLSTTSGNAELIVDNVACLSGEGGLGVGEGRQRVGEGRQRATVECSNELPRSHGQTIPQVYPEHIILAVALRRQSMDMCSARAGRQQPHPRQRWIRTDGDANRWNRNRADDNRWIRAARQQPRPRPGFRIPGHHAEHRALSCSGGVRRHLSDLSGGGSRYFMVIAQLQRRAPGPHRQAPGFRATYGGFSPRPWLHAGRACGSQVLGAVARQ